VSEASNQNLKVSREGIVLIKSFEGFRPRAERRDPDGWIIGYGHTLSAREGATVSEADAELLLQYDLIPVTKAVNDGVAGAVNQHQFDALASFAFSVGIDRFNASDVLQRLKAGSAGEAADALVGWPEPVLASTSLRRRAAERALFVADPASPVALADLLAAPLPPPAVARSTITAPIDEIAVTDATAMGDIEPAEAGADARGVAVASLLGETLTADTREAEPETAVEAPVEAPVEDSTIAAPEAIDAAWEDVAVSAADVQPAPEVQAEADETTVAADAVEPEPSPAPDLPSFSMVAIAAMNQRYSPYAAAVVGPLPGTPLAEAFKPPVLSAPADLDVAAAEPETAEAEAATTETVESAVSPEALVAEPVGVEEPVEVAAETPQAPLAETQVEADPPVELAEPVDYSPIQTPVFETPFTETPAPEVAPAASAVEPLFLTTATEAQNDTAAGLVLTPGDQEPAFSTPRLVWPHVDTADDQAPLFEDDGGLLRGRPLVRDGGMDEPAKFQWGETGAYVVMGGFGLVSFGMSMAAFRLASQQQSGTDETAIIGWVLAIIGFACVSVSAYNLYRRIGRADD